MQNYSLITEKIIKGITVQFWRCDENPSMARRVELSDDGEPLIMDITNGEAVKEITGTL